MYTKLKQHLIISIVIIAIIAIFIPLIFSKYHREKILLQKVVIPQAPKSPLINRNAIGKKIVEKKMSVISQHEQKMEHIVAPIILQQPKAAQSPKPKIKPHTKTTLKKVSLIKKTLPILSLQPKKHETKKPRKTKPTSKIQQPIDIFNLSDPLLTQQIKKLNIRTGDETSSNVQQPTTLTPSTISQKKQQLLKKAKSYNKAWVVQLGYFLNKKNAENLVKKLNKKGFSAFIYKGQINKKPASRVYVGPYIQLNEAKTARDKIKREIKTKGIIIKFKATRLK